MALSTASGGTKGEGGNLGASPPNPYGAKIIDNMLVLNCA